MTYQDPNYQEVRPSKRGEPTMTTRLSPTAITTIIQLIAVVAVGIVITTSAADATSEDPPSKISGECDGTAAEILTAAAFRLMPPSLRYLRADEVGTLQVIDSSSTSSMPELLSLQTPYGNQIFTLQQLLLSFLQHCGR